LAGLDTVETNQLISYGDSTYALTVGGAYVISSVAHIVSSVQVSIDSAWNLVSVPKTRTDYSAASLFPTRIAGSTYEYKKGYAVRDSLVPGKGYWTKFHGASTDTISGTALPSLAVSVDSAWNLIGSLDHEVPVPTGGVIASNIYLYEHGYHTASTLTPGKGYWVKASHSGTINLGTRNAPKSRIKSIAELNTLTIRDVSGNHQELYFGSGQSVGMNELPPMPPAGVFDARFGDNQNVEFADEALAKEVPVSITSAVYPVKLEWTINARQTGIDTLVIDGRRIPLKSSGVVVLPAGGAGISIRLSHAEGLAKPVKFALEQNYPNPFNPTTNIQYSVPARTMVSLKIYNVIGQEVATLVNQEKEAGSYAVSFDASKLSSGVYFYRLQAGGNIDSKKLVLVK